MVPVQHLHARVVFHVSDLPSMNMTVLSMNVGTFRNDRGDRRAGVLASGQAKMR